jgi:hypothetical protein
MTGRRIVVAAALFGIVLMGGIPASAYQAPAAARPSYGPVQFPTVPKRFCSQQEYWRFLNDIINPRYLKAAENAEKAARFRAAVEEAINGYVQAGQPIPGELLVLRRQAAEDYAEQQRLSDEIARLRDQARRTPVVDCSNNKALGDLLRVGVGALMPGDRGSRAPHSYSEFRDARERCDRAAMDAAIRELEEEAREAQERLNGIGDSMQGGPMDQADTPENNAYFAAEADAKEARRLLERARAEARTCPRSTEPQRGPPIERGQGLREPE